MIKGLYETHLFVENLENSIDFYSNPTKLVSKDLKSDGSKVAIESIEISHEGLTIANG